MSTQQRVAVRSFQQAISQQPTHRLKHRAQQHQWFLQVLCGSDAFGIMRPAPVIYSGQLPTTALRHMNMHCITLSAVADSLFLGRLPLP